MTLKIGFIGAGRVALTIARSAVDLGHEVMLSSSHGGATLRAAIADLGSAASAVPVYMAASAEIVILAVPWSRIEQALADLPPWADRILVDATNPFIGTAPNLVLADLDEIGSSEIVGSLTPGAKVVKAFNSIRMSTYDAGPKIGNVRRIIFVSEDHANAKARIGGLIESFGFAVVDLGTLKDGGHMQQAGGPLAGQDLLLASAPSE